MLQILVILPDTLVLQLMANSCPQEVGKPLLTVQLHDVEFPVLHCDCKTWPTLLNANYLGSFMIDFVRLVDVKLIHF